MIKRVFFQVPIIGPKKNFHGHTNLSVELERLNVFFGDTPAKAGIVCQFLQLMSEAIFLSRQDRTKFVMSSREKRLFESIKSVFSENKMFLDHPHRLEVGGIAFEAPDGKDLLDVSFDEDFAEIKGDLAAWQVVDVFESIDLLFLGGATGLQALQALQSNIATPKTEHQTIIFTFPEKGVPPWRIGELADGILALLEKDPTLQFIVHTASPELISCLYHNGDAKPFLADASKDSDNNIWCFLMNLALLDLSPAFERGTRLGELWATMPAIQIREGFELVREVEDPEYPEGLEDYED